MLTSDISQKKLFDDTDLETSPPEENHYHISQNMNDFRSGAGANGPDSPSINYYQTNVLMIMICLILLMIVTTRMTM